ncbi:Scr1 family TA system antitoxin-like transcriptional regulator [Streptomyces sp. NPDC047976]|uniref:Scr1 family TA system antitoxin-like transcriptional regulator n=1 Tax=unclassified Streptomyces TaxID=2593676 RepID=UPI00343B85DE
MNFLGVPDDVPAGVAKHMQRQQVLHDGLHHYAVVLGEQALYTNIGGPDVMRGQIERLLQDFDLPSLSLGILPARARVDLFPVHGFHIQGKGDRVHVELVSSSLDVTEPGELDLYCKAFGVLSGAASYGEDARRLLAKAHSYWASTPPEE